MNRALLIALALLAAGCTPKSVDISEQSSGSLLAVVHADSGKSCDDALKTRAIEEARYYCSARGRKASLGSKIPQTDADGCAYRVEFWCAAE